MRVCGRAKIGSGEAIELLPVRERVYEVKQTVTAFKGVKRSFVSAKCLNSKKLKARGKFTFRDGGSLTAFSKQTCRQAK